MLNNQVTSSRYDRIASLFHWVIGVSILLMLASGLVMKNVDLPQSFKFNLFQWHKSLGVLVLCAVGVRVLWRLFHRPPSPPSQFKKVDVIAAKIGHMVLYALMVILPVSGWVMVSSSSFGLPTIVFGWFEWPHIPDMASNKDINSLAKTIHEIMAWVFIAAIIGHVGAVIKHYMVDNVNLLNRISPFVLMFGVVGTLLWSLPALSAPYTIDTKASTISFSGQHAGNDFSGAFDDWTADITFDPNDLANSSAKIIFNLNSAKTGNAMYDGTLPTKDWFDVKNHPQAVFESVSFVADGDAYRVDGNLMIKDVTKSVSFPFVLKQDGQDARQAHVMASVTLNRLDFNIGAESDSTGEWVSKDIVINLSLNAIKQ